MESSSPATVFHLLIAASNIAKSEIKNGQILNVANCGSFVSIAAP